MKFLLHAARSRIIVESFVQIAEYETEEILKVIGRIKKNSFKMKMIKLLVEKCIR